MPVRTPAELQQQIDTLLASNSDITAVELRSVLTDFRDSLAFATSIPTTFAQLTGQIADGQIPTAITRDAEFMAAIANFITMAAAQNLINNAGHATQAALDALTARVAALEAGQTPTPHALTRYAALRMTGAMPGDFTEANFLASGATTSMTDDIYTPASNDDMVVGVAVPTSEGVLTAVVEIDSAGQENPFGHTRGDFLPALGSTQVTLNIDGVDHYVYCTDSIVRGLFLGVIGFRLTQG